MFLESKRAMVAAGAAAVCVVAIAILAWRAATVSVPAPPQRPSIPRVDAQPPKPAEVPQAPASRASNAPTSPLSSASPATDSPAPRGAAPAPAVPPSFDIVRVEPSGETVVAGRAAPGATVTLLASGKPAGSATADGNGQFVIVPPALPPGSHELTLSQDGGGKDAQSSQSVAVSVPPRGKQEVMVALAEPDKPTRVLTEPAAPSPELAIRSVEAEGGGLFASGSATPGAKLMIYLNDGHIAQAIADKLGQWSLRISRGMTPGQYTVRADQIDEGGKVARRVEAPFSYAPQIAASATPPAAAASPAPHPAPAPLSGSQRQPAGPSQGEAQGSAAKLQTATPSSPAGAGPAPDVTGSAAPASSSAPAPASASTPAPAPAAVSAAVPAAASPSNVTVDQIATANVVRGDSLWRISRRMLGKGVRYTQIYDANTSQIRDPHRIYPGQILVVPVGGAVPDPVEKH